MSVIRYAAKGAFKGRTVLVTGGGGAIGRAASLAFADAGANVVVNDLPGDANSQAEGPAELTVKEIKAFKGSAIAVPGSTCDGQKLVDAAVKQFGRIDVIVNLAGTHEATLFESHTLKDFQRVLEVNTLGPVSTVLAAWPHFKKQKYGRVINITSDTIFGTDKLSSYLFSRGANFIGSRALAIEGAEHNILVNTVAPVAASALAFDYIKDLEASVRTQYQNLLREKCPPEGNVPMILALAHESNTITAESFSIGSWCASRIVLGFQDGVTNVRTMEEFLERQEHILGYPGKEVKVPKDNQEQMQMLQRNNS